MRKERTLLILGVWVAVLSYLGFPQDWRRILFLITGFLIIYLAYLFYIEAKIRILKNDNHSKSFIDNIESSE
jgi:hypothetical protein